MLGHRTLAALLALLGASAASLAVAQSSLTVIENTAITSGSPTFENINVSAAALSVVSGAQLYASNQLTIAGPSLTESYVLVDGAGSYLNIASVTFIGGMEATGTLTLSDHASATLGLTRVGYSPYSDLEGTGTVNVGTTTNLNIQSSLYIGDYGFGTVNVTGTDAYLYVQDETYVGRQAYPDAPYFGQATGTLTIADGAFANFAGNLTVGDHASTGSLTLTGYQSYLSVGGQTIIGNNGGTGTVQIGNGGYAWFSGPVLVGGGTGVGSSMTLSSNAWTRVQGTVTVGDAQAATLSVSGESTLLASGGVVLNNGSQLTVSGASLLAASHLTVDGKSSVNLFGGTLALTNASTINGTLTVDGTSTLIFASDLNRDEVGALTVEGTPSVESMSAAFRDVSLHIGETGTLLLTSTALLQLNLDYLAYYAGAGTYTLLTFASGSTLTNVSLESFSTGISNSAFTYTLSLTPESLSVTIAPIPEPSTWLLMGVGALAIPMLARRRRAPAGGG